MSLSIVNVSIEGKGDFLQNKDKSHTAHTFSCIADTLDVRYGRVYMQNETR